VSPRVLQPRLIAATRAPAWAARAAANVAAELVAALDEVHERWLPHCQDARIHWQSGSLTGPSGPLLGGDPVAEHREFHGSDTAAVDDQQQPRMGGRLGERSLPLVVRSDSEAHHYRLLVEAAECVFASQSGLSKQVP